MLSKFNGDLEHGIFNLNLANLDTEPQQVYEKILRYVPEKQIGGLDRMTENQID